MGKVEERAAKLGAHVELKDLSAFFEVKRVSEMSFEAGELHEKQKRDRNAFASLATA